MSWEIRGKYNEVKAVVDSVEYNGEWMQERYVTVTIESPAPINFLIGDYLIYRGERFEINYDPGKIKIADAYLTGDAFRYENVKFNSLADELTRCDFLDVVLNDNQLHFTGLPKFSFYGGVKQLADRIQANLDRTHGKGVWNVVLASEFTDTTELNVSVDTIKVSGALEILVNQFKTYYTIKGRTLTIGAAGVPADHLFKYGQGKGLYEIEQNAEADQQIVTRLRAYGSTRNIPHRYYNSLSGSDGKALIPDNMAVQYLMLPSFPYITQDPYIDSANIPFIGVREGTIFFDGSQDGLPEIYPSIEGMTAEQLRAAGVPCNSSGELDVLVSAEQIEDNGVGVVDGNETKPADGKDTFKITVKDLGFDIKDYKTAESPTVSFKSGKLGGRDFEIVECNAIKDGSENITGYELELNRIFDEDIKLWFPYNDYNASAGDKFVLLSIEMPEVYIKAASQRLLEAATEWLSKNDYSRSIYAPKIDEIFMARQHDAAIASGGTIKSLHDTLQEGMQLLFEDKDLGIDAAIFIDRLTIIEGEGQIPTYEVVLKEEKTVGRIDKMQNQIDSLAAGMGQGGGGYTASQIRSLISAYGGAMFLSKLRDDRSRGKIASDKGVEVGNYVAGASGAIIGQDAETGQTFGEMDRLFIRIKAYFETLTIINAETLAGEQYITPGGGIKCTSVAVKGLVEVTKERPKVDENGDAVLDEDGNPIMEEYTEMEDNGIPEGVYRCYFLSEQDGEKTETKMIVGDQAISEMFNAKTGTTNKVSNHRYWRLVTGVSNDAYTDKNGNHYGYIDLSKTNCEAGSDAPEAGDSICQLGWQGTDVNKRERQTAMVFSTVDADAPSIKMFSGINSYSLNDKAIISFGRDPLTNQVYFRLGNSTAKQYLEYTQTGGLKVAGSIATDSTIGDQSFEEYIKQVSPPVEREDIESFVDAIVDPKIEGIQNQIDGVIETWFYNGVPTLNNYPASGWNTENLKIQHLGDLYYDNDTGTAYRFSQNTQGGYYWNTITDDAITKALAEAQKAQDTADGKRRVFTSQPTSDDEYDEGDLWVNATYGTQYSNDILRCITHKVKGVAFNISHWTLASKYTDDSALNTFISEYEGTIDVIKTQVDGKAETWHQSTDPSVYWNTAALKNLHVGDLWYCTTDIANTNFKEGTTWYWNGTAWQKQDIPQSVFDTIDGKANVYVAKPSSGYHRNDLWFLESEQTLFDGKHAAGTLVVALRDMGSAWSANDWAKKDRYTDDTLANLALDKITKLDYFTEAFKQSTTIQNGVILSSIVSLGVNNDSFTAQITYSGISGIYDATKRGSGIAAWYGGDMVDIFDYYNAANNTFTVPTDVRAAASLFRMDGTGYLSKGSLWWDAAGNLFLGSGVTIGGDSNGATLASMLNAISGFSSMLVPIDAQGNELDWKNAASAVALKSRKHFCSDGEITALGYQAGGSGSGTVGASSLAELTDVRLTGLAKGQALVYNGSNWVNQAIAGGLDETALASYLSTNNYAKKSDIPSLANYVTLNTAQTISRIKTFSAGVVAKEIQITGTASATGSWIKSDSVNNIFFQAADKSMLVLSAIGNAVRSGNAVAGTISLGTSGTPWDNVYANKFIKVGGTAAQFLKANGDVDDTQYLYHRRVAATTALNIDTGITATGGGLYEINKATGTLPFAADWHKVFDWGTNDSGYRVQLLTSLVTDGPLYLRHKEHDTWHPWRTIVDNVNYASILDGRYVKKAGDTMTGTLNITIDSAVRHLGFGRAGYNYIGASAANGVLAFVTNGKSPSEANSGLIVSAGYVFPGTTNAVSLGKADNRWSNLYANTINVTSTAVVSNLNADMLDGVHSTALFRRNVAWIESNTDALACFGFGVYINAVGNGSGNSNFPDPYGVMPVFSYSDSNYTLRLHGGSSGLLKYQIKFDSTNTGWYTLARTSDNVASASRLATTSTYTAWGQTFFANGVPQSVNGDMTGVGSITASGMITTTGRFSSTRSTADGYHYYFNNETVGVTGGIGTSNGGPGAYLWLTGANNSWRFVTNATERMRITGGGSVLIGATTNSSGEKLHVAGGIGLSGNIVADNYGTRQSTTNPYFKLNVGAYTWYMQALDSYMYIGSTSTKSIRLDANGNLYSPGEITAAHGSSDRRLKHRFSVEDYTERIMRLGAVMDFEWSERARAIDGDRYDTKRHTSVVWQRARKVGIPNFCGVDERGYGFVNWLSPEYHAVVLGAVQQTIREVRRLDREKADRAELEALRVYVRELEGIVYNRKSA